MQFQALFSTRDAEAVHLDGILHDGMGSGRPVRITGARPTAGVLSIVIPATLDAWADEMTIVELGQGRGSLELADGRTRLSLRPLDARI